MFVSQSCGGAFGRGGAFLATGTCAQAARKPLLEGSLFVSSKREPFASVSFLCALIKESRCHRSWSQVFLDRVTG